MDLNATQLAKAKEAKTPEELMALARENGMELTEAEVKTYFDLLHPKSGELTDDELDNVAGGGCYSSSGRLKTTCGYKCRHYQDGPSTYGIRGTCCRCKYWGVDPVELSAAISGGVWSTLLGLIMNAAKAAEPRECFHPANRK